MNTLVASAAFVIYLSAAISPTDAASTSEPDPNLSKLDQNVFKSLRKTQLKDLSGNYSKGYVSMKYVLDNNMIEEVSAQMGEFDLEKSKKEMHAHLPKTKGTLSGVFKVDLTIKRSKFVPVDIKMGGHYIANISDVNLSIHITLPTATNSSMGLSTCKAAVSSLHLNLVSEEHKESDILINLAEWLGKAMQPSFSDLFCDTMQKILDKGPESPIVQALGRRLCLLKTERLKNKKCPPV